MNLLRSAATLSLVFGFVIAAAPARADQEAEVAVRVADLHVQPSASAKTKLRLGGGRSVSVLAKSDDGRWGKIKGEVEKGPDQIPFEGWVEATALRGNLDGIATDKGATATASSGGDSSWGDSGSGAAKSSGGDAAWGDTSAAATATPAASSGGDDWG